MENLTVLIIMLLGFLSSKWCMADVAYSHECENCTDWCSASSGPVETSNYAAFEGDYDKMPSPGLDQALLRIMSKCGRNMTIMSRCSECYKCDYQPLVELGPREHANVLMDTKHATELEVLVWVPKILSPIKVCSDSNRFLEYGNYTYHISPNDSTAQVPGYLCVLSSEDPPMDANIPVWIMLAVICVLFAMWNILLLLDRRYALYSCLVLRTSRVITSDLGIPNSRSVSSNALNNDSGNNENDVQTNNGQATTPKIRLKSLDTFRGLSIVLMIFVNYGGGEYWYFKHASWNGLTVADLVFPWFIFIMGTSMNFSFQSQIRRNLPWTAIFLRILKRSLILIILGLVLNSKPICPHRVTMLETLRIPGVLQRIGVTYFLTSTIHLAFVYKQEASKVYHVLEFLVQLLLISVYLMLTFLLPVPGCPTGYLGPGGWAHFGQYQNCTGGAAGYIDRLIFGPDHMYSHPTSRRIYSGTVPYDPEGVLGCLTSTFLCYLGLQAGLLFNKPCWKPVRYQLLATSVFSSGLGAILCLGSKEDGWIPINKNLWSLSYVLCMAGTGYFLLAITYLLVDRYKLWTGGPFVYAGMNAILLYLGHEIFHGRFPIGFHVDDDHWSQLEMDVWGTVFWIIVAYVLYLKETYFSI